MLFFVAVLLATISQCENPLAPCSSQSSQRRSPSSAVDRENEDNDISDQAQARPQNPLDPNTVNNRRFDAHIERIRIDAVEADRRKALQIAKQRQARREAEIARATDQATRADRQRDGMPNRTGASSARDQSVQLPRTATTTRFNGGSAAPSKSIAEPLPGVKTSRAASSTSLNAPRFSGTTSGSGWNSSVAQTSSAHSRPETFIWKEAVAVCTISPSGKLDMCYGPRTAGAYGSEKERLYNANCSNARSLGTQGKYRVFGCGYGINPRANEPNYAQAFHWDQIARRGLDEPEGRQTFRCKVQFEYCKNVESR